MDDVWMWEFLGTSQSDLILFLRISFKTLLIYIYFVLFRVYQLQI